MERFGPSAAGPTDVRPWWRPRWYELLPEAALAGGLTLFLVDETDAATSALRSTRALALMVVVAAAWVGARILLARVVPWSAARAGVFAAAAVAVLAVVVLPAYDNDTVVETFPQAATGAPGSSAEGATPGGAPVTSAPETGSTVTTLAGGAGPSAATAETVTPRPGAATTPGTAAPAPPVTTAPAPAQPARLAVGSFRGVDHRASGTVALYQRADGRYVVGLEDFDIQPGPDYDVYLVPGADKEDRGDGTRLDDLRGNRGTQYYDVPPGINLASGTWTVLVWCQTFAVPVATATPS